MDIRKEAGGLTQDVISWRRRLHENPELSDHEEDTVAFILERLQEMGITCVDVPQGGVMGFIHGAKPGKTVLLRADIDALPMQEDPCNEKQPKACVSQRPGVAHTCGHDTHAAMLLGAARLLHEHASEFSGSVVLYFERGEENGNGDYYMMQYLLENNIHIDGCWAMHIRTYLPTGTVSILDGGVFAGNTSWSASVSNEKGNALACCCAIIQSLNTLRMRKISPFQRVTLSNTKLQFGTDKVTVPGTCQISGTCRYYDLEGVGRPMRDAIYETIQATCSAYGCDVTCKKGATTRGVINNSQCCDLARKAVGAVLGREALVDSEPAMGAESFSIPSAYWPGVYAFLGAGNPEKGMTALGHHPKFDPDEDAFQYGVAATVAYALAFLSNEEIIEFKGFRGSIDDYLASLRG
ncbi:MAG: amidohydrolase [Oscillospiraceae bacterium]|nr:amidohydrolase [Oscillospiraceae bacterium]